MGCALSSPPASSVFDPAADPAAARDLARVGLEPAVVNRLFALYREVCARAAAARRRAAADDADDGEVADVDDGARARRMPPRPELEDVFAHFGVERSGYAERAFGVFDSGGHGGRGEDDADDADSGGGGGGGGVSFRAFALNLWNFLTLGHDALLRFSFSLLDPDATGFVDAEDVGVLVREVHGGSADEAVIALSARLGVIVEAARRAGAASGGRIFFPEFKQLCASFPALLFPAFSLQLRLRSRALGLAFWLEQDKRRQALAARTRSRAGAGAGAGAGADRALFSLFDVLDELDRVSGRIHAGAGSRVSQGGAAKEAAALRRRELHGGQLRSAHELVEAGAVAHEPEVARRGAELAGIAQAQRERDERRRKARRSERRRAERRVADADADADADEVAEAQTRDAEASGGSAGLAQAGDAAAADEAKEGGWEAAAEAKEERE